MINACRTLLLNRTGTGFSSRTGEEYISPDFSMMENLPFYLSSVRRSLFSGANGLVQENYRVRQYMSLLHSTELREFVTSMDPRITYDVSDHRFFDASLSGTEIFDGTIKSLGEMVLILENEVAVHLSSLFGVGTPRSGSEPWKTFRNLWLNNSQLPYRLGGLLLAVAYAMEGIRTADGN